MLLTRIVASLDTLSNTMPSSTPAHNPTRVMLADDQAKVRSALRLLIEQELAFNVVGEAGTADELLRGILKTYPQVVLLNWELPGLSETHKLDSMRLIDPRIKVIVLSSRPEARKPALDDGADSFVSKSEPPDGVLRALYFVYDKASA